ncbi:uncharacterized protein LOC143989110 isoform X2 [Lithobates pipiens]
MQSQEKRLMGKVGAPGTEHGAGGSAEELSELIPGTGGRRRRTLSSGLSDGKILTPTLKDRPGRGEAGAPDTIPEPEGDPGLDDHQRALSNDLHRIQSLTTFLKNWSFGSEWCKKRCKKSVIWGLLIFAVITVVVLCVKIGNVPVCKCPSCPNKWTKYDDLCYFVSKNSAMWLEGHQYCEKEGGSLLILNETVQRKNQIPPKGSFSCGGKKGHQFCLGATSHDRAIVS